MKVVMEMSPQPISPPASNKLTKSEPKNSLLCNNDPEDIGGTQNSNDSENCHDKQDKKSGSGKLTEPITICDKDTLKYDDAKATITNKSNNCPPNNECSNSNTSNTESVDSSRQTQVAESGINLIPAMQKVDDSDSGPNDEDSDGEDDSEEDSSDDDGSGESDTPHAEDTVSISDSDQERPENKASTLQSPTDTKNKDKKNSDKNVNRNKDNVHTSQSSEVHEIISDTEDHPIVEGKSNSNQCDPAEVPRRRSGRAAVKRRNYSISATPNGNADSDIEELLTNASYQKRNKNEPIVVNDTKALVEMAAKQIKTNNGTQKKEPTLVIIDTNSLLSSNRPLSMAHGKTNTSSSVSAEDLYQSIAARGTTVTPVHPRQASTSVQTTHPIILPSLTDDMFVVEAPSFIVPYVYEKPSVKAFREFVDVLGRELDKLREKEESERLLKENLDKEKPDSEKNATEETAAITAEIAKSTLTSNTPLEDISKGKKPKKNRKHHGNDEDDASWDGQSSSDSEDEAISDDDQGTTIVIKDKEDDSLENLKNNITANFAMESKPSAIKSDNYFENALGKFFTNIGLNLVQEYVQTDLLKQQKRKLHKELKIGDTDTKPIESAIHSLSKNLEFSKENNAPYSFPQKKCKFCSFKTESLLVMSHHMETPHMKNNVYTCNFCSFEIKSPHDILYHMEENHNTRGRLERAPAYHQCANCPFEDNGKGKLARHLIPCAKKFKPELNLAPPVEWEPPAKIPKMTRARNTMMSSYQAAFNRAQVGASITSRPPINMASMVPNMVANFRARGRSPMGSNSRGVPPPLVRGNMRQSTPQLLPSHYSLMNAQGASKGSGGSKMLQHQPSISITPLPRAPLPVAPPPAQQNAQQQQSHTKGCFVICEICDGYIKDLMTLRNHMQWIHKVKIHVKMIYNRPPLNCQKCQFRFFTDQGLERHLLGSHGLVTSSMQEAANKGKDAGRCPVCGRVYQWKLLNHVARDHNLTLKPAHLSYKCTVCTATFGMYKQFENHVYSAHSVVAKRVMDKSKSTPTIPPKGSIGSVPLVKPIKINDEITIIPQPTSAAKGKKD